MSDPDDFDDEGRRPRRVRGFAVVAAIVATLGLGVWWLSHDIAGVGRTTAPPPTINLLPPPPPEPPPPPPPPPTKEPPPPEKADEPKPTEQPKSDQPRQMTIAGPAQAGGDSFGMKAGSGGEGTVLGGGSGDGPGGGDGGLEEASYARFLSAEIQQAIQANPRVDRAFGAADVAIWISGGRVTQVKIRRSCGNDRIDAELVATLEHMPPLSEPPPPAFKFPREIKVRGALG